MRRTRPVLSLAVLGLLWGVAPAPLAAAPAVIVQPGSAVVVTDVASCTAGFVFDGVGRLAGRVYVALAAHCVEDRIGAVVTDAEGGRFGVVAFSMWPYETFADDVAFVLVDRAARARVSPAMAGHPDLPTGAVGPADTAIGDRLQLSGWGMATEQTATTREQRVTVLKDHTDALWSAWGVMSPGDSGGPVAHLPSGGALGSVSNLCVPMPVNTSEGFEQVAGCFGYGPSVTAMITRAATRGFTVRIRTAAQGPAR